MNKSRQIVDEIRLFLQSADRSVSERSDDPIRLVAIELEKACTSVNDRLRRCALYLGQGLRSEALYLACLDPNILELTGILDFPERKEWDELAAMYGLTRAPSLLLNAAATLNTAFNQQEKLAPTYREHRLLALIRAPITERLQVLNKLAVLDVDIPFWEDDILTFEKARFDEIQVLAKKAERSGDYNELRQLVMEIEAYPWKQKVPTSLVNQVTKALSKKSTTSP